MNSVSSNNLSLKYKMFELLGFKDIGFIEFEFVAKTRFLYLFTWSQERFLIGRNWKILPEFFVKFYIYNYKEKMAAWKTMFKHKDCYCKKMLCGTSHDPREGLWNI